MVCLRVTGWQVVDVVEDDSEVAEDDELGEGLADGVHVAVDAASAGRFVDVFERFDNLKMYCKKKKCLKKTRPSTLGQGGG